MKKIVSILAFQFVLGGLAIAQSQDQDSVRRAFVAAQAVIQKQSAEDHKQMMDQLHITSLRPGPSGDPKAPNYANVDESQANPYTSLPDPLVMKNNQKVTTAQQWWSERRPEIVEDFDREVYGRMPKNLPKVTWQVVSDTSETKAGIPIRTRKLVGHVDNSSYPSIIVNIQLTLTTPANVKRPVPVIMEFGFVFPPGFRFPTSHPPVKPPQPQPPRPRQPGRNRFWQRVGAMPC